MDSRKKDEMGEAQLLALLASLKVEATPEANFEERFLYDFHDRIARETVCCPAHQRVWEHLMQFLHNFGKRKLVFGASTLGVGALTMGYMIVPSSTDDSTNPRVLVAKRFDDAVQGSQRFDASAIMNETDTGQLVITEQDSASMLNGAKRLFDLLQDSEEHYFNYLKDKM